jgi:hypothetical protein
MDKLAHIIDAARALNADERRRLISALDTLEVEHESVDETPKPYAALLALSGTGHCDFTDLASDKYKHVAAASDDRR